jgi:hypothetical protein
MIGNDTTNIGRVRIIDTNGDLNDATHPLYVAGTSAIVGGNTADVKVTLDSEKVQTQAYRGTPVAHRTGITAIDKVTSPTAVGAAAAGTTDITLATTNLYLAIAAGNVYGTAGAGTVSAAFTPTENKSVALTVAQATGATYYDIFMSVDAAPKWVGRITETQRASGIALTAVGTTGASEVGAGKVDIQVVGTGIQTSNAVFAVNNAYIPETVATAATAVTTTGYAKAYIDVDLTLTDLRSAPALSIMAFTKTGSTWYACEPKALTVLSSVGYPLRQAFSVDVGGADAVEVLVGTISGQGASAAFTVTPGA